MLRKTIQFEDFDGNQVEETFYFNLTKAEIIEMELDVNGGMASYLQKIVNAEDNRQIVQMFKKIIEASIGRKSENGHRFIKNDEIRAEFMETNAYSELFLELAGDAEAAVEFIKGVMPSDLESIGAKTPNLQQADQERKAALRKELEAKLAELNTGTDQ